jgi:hypothetical protein
LSCRCETHTYEQEHSQDAEVADVVALALPPSPLLVVDAIGIVLAAAHEATGASARSPT